MNIPMNMIDAAKRMDTRMKMNIATKSMISVTSINTANHAAADTTMSTSTNAGMSTAMRTDTATHAAAPRATPRSAYFRRLKRTNGAPALSSAAR